jgi:hypothetical protein
MFHVNIGRKVDKRNIFVFSNYTGHYDIRDFYREYLALHVLTILKERALDMVENFFRNSYRIELNVYKDNKIDHYVNRIEFTTDLLGLN